MGRDKAFVSFDGEPLWQRQVQLLRTLQPQEIFIAGPARPEWRSYSVIEDATPHAGPVPVVASALRLCATPLLLVLAVDLPRMAASYLRTLVDCHGVVPRGQPLCAVYPREAALLAENCGSAQEFAQRCAVAGLVRLREIASNEEQLFFNMNTPEDLAAISTDASRND